jgi:hypothetical protein
MAKRTLLRNRYPAVLRMSGSQRQGNWADFSFGKAGGEYMHEALDRFLGCRCAR